MQVRQALLLLQATPEHVLLRAWKPAGTAGRQRSLGHRLSQQGRGAHGEEPQMEL